MIHMQFYIQDLYISVSFLFLLLPLSTLKSHSLGVFVVKVEMSSSRERLSNPTCYAFQPHTPYLLLTASNWNGDHIFHTVPQPHSLLEPKTVKCFFLHLVSPPLSPWCLSSPPSLCSSRLPLGIHQKLTLTSFCLQWASISLTLSVSLWFGQSIC